MADKAFACYPLRCEFAAVLAGHLLLLFAIAAVSAGHLLLAVFGVALTVALTLAVTLALTVSLVVSLVVTLVITLIVALVLIVHSSSIQFAAVLAGHRAPSIHRELFDLFWSKTPI
jgi:hypothetical protein